MRAFWIWAVVFLSGFLCGVIVSPVLMGPSQTAPTRVDTVTAPPSASPPPASSPLPTAQPGRRDGDDAYRAVALDTLGRVRAGMRDPDSVQFRNLLVVHVAGGQPLPEWSAVCGEVNGRNGFGAYAGFTPFIAADDYLITAEDSSFGVLFKENCNPGQLVMPLIY